MEKTDPQVQRHVYGPRHVAALLPAVTRAAFRHRSPAAAQVMADWAQIVGPALAAETAPRVLKSGTLTIACNGPIALELSHLADQLRARINAHFGRQIVTALRFTQTLGPTDAIPAPTTAPPDHAAVRAAHAAVAELPEGGLKAALAALGALVLAAPPVEKSASDAPSTQRPKKR
jgi:hypothetical protein